MKPGHDRRHGRRDLAPRVTSYSLWRPIGIRGEVWKVTALYLYEQSSDRVCWSVRIHCFGGRSDGVVRHMSEARLLRQFMAAP